MIEANQQPAVSLLDEIDHLRALSPQTAAMNFALTLGVVFACLVVIWLLRRMLCFALRAIPGLTREQRKTQVAKVLGLTHLVMSTVTGLLTIVAIAYIWGLDPLAWTSTMWGKAIATTGSRLVVVIGITAIAWEAASLSTQYALGQLQHRVVDNPRQRAQIQTLGPIFRSAVQITIVVIALMTVLSQVGVEIAPILAGAGVAGIAVGFGAQTLVKDFFTGFFLIIEDIVAVGDVVQIQAFSGTVEEMTLRTIRLRDFDGTLHVLPYGESQIIHNMTKTFSYAALDIWVGAGTDIDKAVGIMRQTAETLKKDDAIGPLMMDGIEIPGVDAMTDAGILIKGRIRTQPDGRWLVVRAYNRLLKMAFDTAQISLGHKV
ncbi:mechanosensitive ion channel family protein [Asticcacaulis solisilvae]|uniref:mechanosensitive ion channel family protein n=1 Tax=Asticcacaulis solisilvae TaxID=1217274 RepID=UPI003FD7381B